jgi:hypothetical protein
MAFAADFGLYQKSLVCVMERLNAMQSLLMIQLAILMNFT